MLAPNSTRSLVDLARLAEVIEPVARAHGAEVAFVEFKSEGGWILRVYVEKLGSADSNADTKAASVDLDLCSAVARDLSPALDVADLIPHRYSLEVSSPGLERPLLGERDFARFAGKKAKVKLTRAVAGQKVLVGILGGVDEKKNISVRDGSRSFEAPLADVEKAHLVFEFGPAPKPGQRGASRGAGKKASKR